MKRILVFELMIYVAILIIAVVMLLGYKPEEKRIQIPKDFKIDWRNGSDPQFIK